MYIRHITLTTGHSRDSAPDEVSEDIRTKLRPVIARLAEGEIAESVPLPGMPGYSISGRATTHCLTAVVWSEGPPSIAIASIGVAAHSRCGATLWRALHRWGETPVATDPERCPPEPWVAVALDAGIVGDPAVAWLGDFERCLAWAFVAPLE